MINEKTEPNMSSKNEELARRVCDFLETAGEQGSLTDFESALIKQPDLANACGGHPYGWGYEVQALHVAAMRGQDEKIKMLLERNANINAVDGSGCTPLQVALIYRRLATARLLADKGAIIDLWTAAGLGDEAATLQFPLLRTLILCRLRFSTIDQGS